jgi:hypothetical protein
MQSIQAMMSATRRRIGPALPSSRPALPRTSWADLPVLAHQASSRSAAPFPTANIVLNNRIYIPIPDPLVAAFVPGVDERKRFEVRCDFLYTDV